MVEYNELKTFCGIYHWLSDDMCELLALKQGGTFSKYEVECNEENCPIIALEDL